MRPVTKLSFFTRPFAHQKTVRIGARLMGVVTALLTVKIHPAVASIARIVISRSFFTLGPKTLKARPGLDQRPVHRKMIVAHQPRSSGLPDHCVEKQSSHFVLHQPLAVLAEHRGIKLSSSNSMSKNQRNRRL